MAAEADEPKPSPPPALHIAATANEGAEHSDASSSDSDSEAGGEQPTTPAQVEWLATGRAKRSTAGNRMKSMLANETPADEDSDLELLFQEDEDDAGFTDKEDGDGSDVQMDSSDDDDADNDVNADDLEGEKELERQAREKKIAARKRKAQEAIPAKFRKKVRISQPAETPTPTNGSSAAAATQPRPKKKSERSSWLPTEADMPTRASERKTTRLSKEQLHQQMIEREARRKKQVEAMERKAKKLEAMKKPPMTQAERLAEAGIVEKRNSKSLNRWEEAEKQREEERRAKLAALHNRRLEGPVVSFWTGIVDLSQVQLKHVGKMVTMEEKPKRKRPSTAVGTNTAPPKADSEAHPPTTTTPAPTVPKTESSLPHTASSTPIAPNAPAEAPVVSQEVSAGPKPTKTESPPAMPVDATTSQAEPPTFASSIHSPAASTPPVFTMPVYTPPAPVSTVSQPLSSLSASAPPVSAPPVSASPVSAPPVSVSPVQTSPAIKPPAPAPSASAPPASVAPMATTEAPALQVSSQLSGFTKSASLASRPISPATTSKPMVTNSGITIPPIPLTTASPSPAPVTPPVKTESQAPKSLPLALRLDAGPRFMPPPNPHLAQTSQLSVLAPPAGVPSAFNGPLPVLGYAAARVPRGPGYTVPISPMPSPVNANPPPQVPSHTPPQQPPQSPQTLSQPVSQPPSQPPSQALPPTSSQAPPQASPQPSPQPPSQVHPQANPLSRPSPPIPAPVVTPSLPLPKPQLSPSHTTASFEPIAPLAPPVRAPKKQQTDQATTKKAANKSTASRKPPPPPEPPEPEPPMEGKVTRSCIILQDFDEDAIKKPEVQTQILFGRRMNKLGKPPQPPLCVITNHPARYRDPKTGLPFYNAHAFKEIQKLIKGDFRWSQAMGTWVGKGGDAAKGVPKRFLRPETAEERKERLERKEQEKKLAEEQEKGKEQEQEKAKTTNDLEMEPLSDGQTAAPPDSSGPFSVVHDDAAEPHFAAMPDPAGFFGPAPVQDATDSSPSVPAGVPTIMPSPDDGKPVLQTQQVMPAVPVSGSVTNATESNGAEIEKTYAA